MDRMDMFGDAPSSGQSRTTKQYKDTLFRALFSDKVRLLELYNALEGTSYPPTTNVSICNIGSESILARNNDLAFIIEDQIVVICEHQSTVNYNMPLRILTYMTDILNLHIIDNSALYRTKRVDIPTPKFYVLYNGTDEKVGNGIMKLSDSFRDRSVKFDLELVVNVLNINYGAGAALLNRSSSLSGYSLLVHQIVSYIREGNSRDKAIGLAVDYCIKNGVLVDYLSSNYKEVCKMLNFEYDAELEKKVLLEDGREEGREEGRLRGIEEVACKLLRSGFDAPTVVKHTGLSIETVLNLKSSV